MKFRIGQCTVKGDRERLTPYSVWVKKERVEVDWLDVTEY